MPGGLRNVVGTLPGRGRPILVGAHYDTKDIPGFVGANDGASGVAVVLELSRALRAGRRACDREIRFVMFDGEESPAGSPDARFLQDGLRGSRAYAAAHAGELGAAIVVNMVGDRDLSIPREAGSDARMWRMLRGSAERVGAGAAFPPRTAGRILDDHTPFAQRGVPAIDLIDFGYPPWHTRADRLDKVSARSLELTGEPLADMLQRLARQTCKATRPAEPGPGRSGSGRGPDADQRSASSRQSLTIGRSPSAMTRPPGTGSAASTRAGRLRSRALRRPRRDPSSGRKASDVPGADAV